MLHADKTAGGAQGQLHALARIKLAELGRQRGALRSHFERARAEASEKDSPAEKLRVLSDALTSADAAFASGTARGGAAGSTGVLSVGDHANLKSFVDQATQFPATVAPATVAGWVAKLEKDIDKSLKRADMAWLFGKVLEEWVSANGGDDSEAEEESDDWLMMEDPAVMADRDAFVRDKVHGLLLKIPEAPTPGVKAHLDSIFAPFASQLEDIRKQVAAFCTRPPSSSSSPLGPTTNNGGLYAPVSPAELRSALAAVLRDNLLGPAGRAQLRAIQASEDLATEYATVLTIRMLAGVEAWDWDPEAPPKLELHVNKALKIRPFVVPPDPLTALYHQIVGARLGVRAKGLLEKLWSAVEEKVKKDNYPDLTNSWAPYQSVAQGRNVLGGFLFCASLPDNVEMQEHTTGYGGSSAPQYLSKKQALLHWMLAEIGFAKYGPAENPDSDAKGVLVKGDVADFYLSIEVDVCLSVLEFFGFPTHVLDFFRRFLTPSVKFTDPSSGAISLQKMARGVPLAHSLSRLASELILFGTDVAVCTACRGGHELFSRRVVDDVHFFSPAPENAGLAWKTWKASLAGFGLRENPNKCGSAAVAGDTEALVREHGLPQGPVTWNFLTLDLASLEFRADRSQLDSHLSKLRARLLARSGSLLAAVNYYNTIVARDVTKMLGIAWNPSSYILDQGLEALDKAYGEFFDGKSVVEWIRAECERRFGVDGSAIPEGWMLWPITAGGLGLMNPLYLPVALRNHMAAKAVREGPYRFEDVDASLKSNNVEGTGAKNVVKDIIEDDDDDEYESDYDDDDEDLDSEDQGAGDAAAEPVADRGKAYRKWLRTMSDYGKVMTLYGNLHPAPEPTSTPNLSSLVDRFVDRGSEVRGAKGKGSKKKKQVSLSPYYKWLLSIMSDQVISEFGSLGLTSTQLIPFALIGEIRSTDRMMAAADDAD